MAQNSKIEWTDKELNDVYAKCGAMYLSETEYKNEIPTLFDALLNKAV